MEGRYWKLIDEKAHQSTEGIVTSSPARYDTSRSAVLFPFRLKTAIVYHKELVCLIYPTFVVNTSLARSRSSSHRGIMNSWPHITDHVAIVERGSSMLTPSHLLPYFARYFTQPLSPLLSVVSDPVIAHLFTSTLTLSLCC